MLPDTFKSIQFLRFIAAFLVALSHAEYISRNHWPRMPMGSYLFGFGACGVHIFFVISGFVMVYATFARSRAGIPASKFVWRRFVRIFPIYWIYAAVYLAAGHQISLRDTIGSLLLLPGYSSLIIGQGWTLSFELYFYICFCRFDLPWPQQRIGSSFVIFSCFDRNEKPMAG
jgi:exopolysaccharide production protein ExoZ